MITAPQQDSSTTPTPRGNRTTRLRGLVLLAGGIACLLAGAIWSEQRQLLMAGGALMIVAELLLSRGKKGGNA